PVDYLGIERYFDQEELIGYIIPLTIFHGLTCINCCAGNPLSSQALSHTGGYRAVRAVYKPLFD
ncbi:MAG: hypothetical protein NT174_05635, partial [Actinobacteria bacterium]|nr:hypothetical protein [Actinomycetota bacterium]